MISKILDLVFPIACNICNSPIIKGVNPVICKDCWKRIALLKDPYCPLCAGPFISEETLSNAPTHICGVCRSTKRYYTKVVAVGRYKGVLREIIHLFKYKKRTSLARPLGDLLWERCKEEYHRLDMILPVPLHVKRLKEREFNQSYLLGYRLSKYLDLPIIPDNLIRIRWTRPQVELNGKERAKNVRGVFVLNDHTGIKDKSILLIDDVYTTGSTVNECAKVLKKGGAKEVYVLTLARME